MDAVLYVTLGIVALFLLSLTPIGVCFRRWMMVKMYEKVQRKYEAHVGDRKRELFAGLNGTVLEIGPGNGVNFQYLPDSIDRWIGIEPNPYMHGPLRAAGDALGIPTDFREVTAEGMNVEDGSVDVALSTLVLCSVADPVGVVRDIHRSLRPGGRFVFLEHIAAEPGTRLRRAQGLLNPLWRYMADGCHLNRDLTDIIRGAGFAELSVDEFTVPKEVGPAVVSRQVAGVAIK